MTRVEAERRARALGHMLGPWRRGGIEFGLIRETYHRAACTHPDCWAYAHESAGGTVSLTTITRCPER